MLPPGRGGAALADQDVIVRRVRDYCAALAARQPVVVLLDDLHWADPASLDLLRAVARDLAGLPLLLVVTYRADEVGGGHPLATLLPLLVREARAARLDLRPLDGAAIAALVASRYALAPADHIRLVGYLTGRTEGNALFLGELLRTLEGEGALRPGTREVGGDGWVVGDLAGVPVPTLLGQVITGRLRRLPPETQQLLPLAAVIGQAVPLTLWAAVAGTGEEALLDAIDAAVAAHLLAEAADGRSVRFAHALIREALYGDLPPAHRRRAHLAAGEVLAATARPDPDAVADHFQRAGDARAAEWLERAGARAQAAYAYLTAIERYEAALALLEAQGAGAGVRSWLLLRLAVTRRYASMARALVHAEEAARLAGAADDPLLIGMSTFLVGQVHCTIGDSIRGIAEMTAGLDALDALPPEAQVPPGVDAPLDPALRRGTVAEWLAGVGRYADAHVGLGLAYAGLGQPERAHAALARARAPARRRQPAGGGVLRDERAAGGPGLSGGSAGGIAPPGGGGGRCLAAGQRHRPGSHPGARHLAHTPDVGGPVGGGARAGGAGAGYRLPGWNRLGAAGPAHARAG